MMKYTTLPLVIDPGSETLKAGFAGELTPSVVCPDLISKVRHAMSGKPVAKDIFPPGVADAVDSLLEEESGGPSSISTSSPTSLPTSLHTSPHTSPPSSPSSVLTEMCDLHIVESPVDHGFVVDWDVMQEVLEQTFNEKLNVTPSEHAVLMADSPLSTNYMREKMTQVMFETFDVAGLYIQDTPVLSLYGVGMDTGLVVESGHGSTRTCVVQHGRTLRETIPKTFYSGNDVTRYLSYMIVRKLNLDCSMIDFEPFAKDIKEKLCFVSEDYATDIELALNSDVYTKDYLLPNGESIALNKKRFLPTESIFRPKLFGCNCPGIHCQIVRTLSLAPPEVRQCACQNILLSGGNTMFPGFRGRLQNELNKLIPSVLAPTVLEFPDQLYAAWTGGSKMAASEHMATKWITPAMYNEYGPMVINKKIKV